MENANAIGRHSNFHISSSDNVLVEVSQWNDIFNLWRRIVCMRYRNYPHRGKFHRCMRIQINTQERK